MQTLGEILEEDEKKAYEKTVLERKAEQEKWDMLPESEKQRVRAEYEEEHERRLAAIEAEKSIVFICDYCECEKTKDEEAEDGPDYGYDFLCNDCFELIEDN